jgi:hypothetical protein
LLEAAGYPIERTNQKFSRFGLGGEGGMPVKTWLATLTQREIARVIDTLKDW